MTSEECRFWIIEEAFYLEIFIGPQQFLKYVHIKHNHSNSVRLLETKRCGKICLSITSKNLQLLEGDKSWKSTPETPEKTAIIFQISGEKRKSQQSDNFVDARSTQAYLFWF